MRTTLNVGYIRNELVWSLQLTLNQLNQRAGFAEGYIYQLLNAENPIDVKLSTIDSLWTAAMVRFAELNADPPDDLWDRMIRHQLGD